MDRFLAFEGKTGPYIQYTIARINSIISKTGKDIEALKSEIQISNVDERNIAVSILKLLSSFKVCVENSSLNTLCMSAFDVASAFSTFYNNHKILTETDEKKKNSMLALSVLVKLCLEKTLWVLGIDAVEKM